LRALHACPTRRSSDLGSCVTVNTILPGPTRTEGAIAMMAEMAKERGVSPAEMEALFLAENRPSTLIKRFASPEEVANMCVYTARSEEHTSELQSRENL